MNLFIIIILFNYGDSAHDCWGAKSLYTGTVSHSETGRKCQNWNTNYPHRFNIFIIQ